MFRGKSWITCHAASWWAIINARPSYGDGGVPSCLLAEPSSRNSKKNNLERLAEERDHDSWWTGIIWSVFQSLEVVKCVLNPPTSLQSFKALRSSRSKMAKPHRLAINRLLRKDAEAALQTLFCHGRLTKTRMHFLSTDSCFQQSRRRNETLGSRQWFVNSPAWPEVSFETYFSSEVVIHWKAISRQ